MGAFINGVYHEHAEVPFPAATEKDWRAFGEKLKAEGDAAHARIDAALSSWSSALDREGGPVPMPDPKAELNRRIARILREVIDAQSLASCLNDPREKRLTDALIAMPGSGD